MIGQLNSDQIEAVLQQQLLGRIGCHMKGITYVVPVCYAYFENCIYARTYEGIKIKIMRQNPDVCFEVEAIESMVDWKTIICQGKYEELTDINKREAGMKILHDRVLPQIGNNALTLSPHWPFSSIGTDDNNIKGIIFCIHLNEKTGRFENDIYTE